MQRPSQPLTAGVSKKPRDGGWRRMDFWFPDPDGTRQSVQHPFNFPAHAASYPPSTSKALKPELTVSFLQESPTSPTDEGVRKGAPGVTSIASEGEAPTLALGFILTSSGLSPQFLGEGEDTAF